MDDVRAVMDAVGSERAVLWSGGTSTGIGVLFAATYPERCAGLVLFDPTVKGTRSSDYPWSPTEEEWRERLAGVRAGWGERGYLENLAQEWAPEVAENDDFRDWFVWHIRRSLSPGAALTSFRTAMDSMSATSLPRFACRLSSFHTPPVRAPVITRRSGSEEPRSSSYRSSVASTPGLTTRLTARLGSLWITGRGTDLLKVNPADGSLERTIEIGASGIDVVADGDDLWVPTRSATVDRSGFPTMDALKRISASSGAVSTVVDASGRVDVHGLAARNGTVWFADNTKGRLYQLPKR